MTTVEIDERAAQVAGLRKIADAIEANPAMELLWPGSAVSALGQYVHDRESMAAWVALLDDPVEQTDREWHEVAGRIKGLRVSVKVQAKNVGRMVTREVEQFEVEPFLPVQS